MVENPKNSRNGFATMGCATIAGLVLVLVLYVLSVGPAASLVRREWLPKHPAFEVYLPLTVLGKWSPAFRNALSWYINLWVVLTDS